MTATTTPDLLDEGFYADLDGMHEALAHLRANDPVYRDPTTGMIGVTRHADVVDVERRAKVFVSSRGYRDVGARRGQHDRPGRPWARGAARPRGAPPHAAGRRPRRAAAASAHRRAARRDGGPRAGGGRRRPRRQLPSRLTADLLGFPQDRWRDLKSWSERLMRLDSIPRDETGQVRQGVVSSIKELQAYLDEAVPRFRAEPNDSFISVWANATVRGCPMKDHTIMDETGLFISGGAETTRTAIARGLRAFCDHPDQWERLAEDLSLVPGAVEEVLRWVSPLNQMFRTAAADDRIGDTPVWAGDRIALLYPSANRDEAVFADPFRFDITRRPNPHVAFGFGPHVCIGQSLARLELQLLFAEMPRRFTNLRVASEPVIERNIFAGAVERFELAFDRR